MTRPELLTVESARAGLRSARNLHLFALRYELTDDAALLFEVWGDALARYRYARSCDLEYAARLEDHGINLRELRAQVIGDSVNPAELGVGQ